MAQNDPRPAFDAPEAVLQAGISVDANGTVLYSDDSSFDPTRDGADADIDRLPPGPEPVRPGFHPDFRNRIDSYSEKLPGDWKVTAPDPFSQQWRERAQGIYWARAPAKIKASELWPKRRLQGKVHKLLTPYLQDDLRIICSVAKDRTISSMSPLITTVRPKHSLLKSDIYYFLLTSGVVEYRMMDALFAAIACIPDVRGPNGYDYGTPYQTDTVALPAITWDYIYRKFRVLEGGGPLPTAPPAYLPGPIDPSINEPGDPTNVHNSLLTAHAVLLPILVEADHWMFAYIHYGRKTILIVNSDHEAKDAQQKYRAVEKYLHYWNVQNLSGGLHKYPKKWETRHICGIELKNVTRRRGSGLATILGALLVICDVDPNWEIDTPPADIRAFLAAALSKGGFRGPFYFPRQDAEMTRPWADLLSERGFWDSLGRPVIARE